MIFLDTALNYLTCVVEVSYKCQTQTRVGYRGTPNHRGVHASYSNKS
jgi:hypothetical protein